MDNILEPKPPKNFHSIEERCEDLRSQLVGYTIRYLKRLKEWTDAYVKNYKPNPVPLDHTVFIDRLTGDCSPRRDFCSSRQYLKYLVMRYCSKIMRLYSFIRRAGVHRM